MQFALLTVLFIVTATPVLAQTAATSDTQPGRSNDGNLAGIEQIQKAPKEKGHDPAQIDGKRLGALPVRVGR